MAKDKELSILEVKSLTTEDHASYMRQMESFVQKEMTLNADYGVIPGTKDKTLYDPGAEKLARRYNLVPSFEELEKVEDWEKGFFYYKYKCRVIFGPTGVQVGEADRSCNSKESKYRNKSAFDLANTCLSMAQKRAFVEAVRTATMTSSIFKTTEADPQQSGSSNKKDNERRNSLMMKMFATASERGFSPEGLQQSIYKTYEVESTNDLTNAQLNEVTERLIKEWRAVGRGNKTERINGQASPSPSPSPSDLPAEEEQTAQDEEELEVIYCRNTEKHGDEKVEGKDEFSTFCSTDCRDQYWKEGEYSPNKRSFQFSKKDTQGQSSSKKESGV